MRNRCFNPQPKKTNKFKKKKLVEGKQRLLGTTFTCIFSFILNFIISDI